MSESTILTVGTALYRAWDTHREIQVLVTGAGWLTGTVSGVDGHGAVLTEASQTHLVLRLESIQAVRIEVAAPKVPQQHGYRLEVASA